MSPAAGNMDEWSRFRLGFLAVLMMGALAYLGSALHTIQVKNSKVYLGAQNETSFRRVRLPATRGRILDRNGNVLADSKPRYCAAFYLDELRASGRWSNTVNRIEQQIAHVSSILGLKSEVDRDGIWAHLYRRRPIPLIAFRDLDETALAKLAEWPEPLTGVDIFVQQDRFYPYGDLACHIIGYVGKGNPSEKPAEETIPQQMPEGLGDEGAGDFDFFLPDVTGRDGIEKRYDAELAGRSGGELMRIDAIGYKREVIPARNPEPGNDVVLSLDVGIQKLAEDALGTYRGSAIVLDARTGDILALASAPRYDLGTFVPTLRSDVWRTLRSDPQHPLYHRALSGTYPPGSVVKPLVAMAALEAGAASADTHVYCDGGYSVGNRRIRCASRWGHGNVGLSDAIAFSCNPYFMELGLRLGWQPGLFDTYRNIGFGSAPQIGIHTGSGFLPSMRWKQTRHKDKWRAGDTAYCSIGQGYLGVSPLQIALATLTLANDGEILAPRLVLDPGTGVRDEGRRVTGNMGWSKENCERVRKGMIATLHHEHGTGRRAAIPGLTCAGKTGTAEYYEEKSLKKHAWMICYAPAENPRYAFTVVCEDADSGGHAAAAVMRELLLGLFPATPAPGSAAPPSV